MGDEQQKREQQYCPHITYSSHYQLGKTYPPLSRSTNKMRTHFVSSMKTKNEAKLKKKQQISVSKSMSECAWTNGFWYLKILVLSGFLAICMYVSFDHCQIGECETKEIRWEIKTEMNKWLTLNKFRLVYDDIQYLQRHQLKLKWSRKKKEKRKALVIFFRCTFSTTIKDQYIRIKLQIKKKLYIEKPRCSTQVFPINIYSNYGAVDLIMTKIVSLFMLEMCWMRNVDADEVLVF